MNQLAQNIKHLRKSRRMTQADLADMLGVGRSNISNWEKGVSRPSLDKIQTIANYFGIPIDDVVSKKIGNDTEIGKEKSLSEEAEMSPIISHLSEEKGGKMSPNKVDTEEDLVMASDRPGTYGLNRRSTDDFRKLLLPGITGKARTFRISGTSMFPVLREGDIIVCVPAEIDQVEDGQVYAIIDKQLNVSLKYAYSYAEGILMVPANREEYHPIVIEKKEIREIWKAVLRLTSDLPEFGEVGANQDLEKKIAQLEHFIRKMFPDYGDIEGDFGK